MKRVRMLRPLCGFVDRERLPVELFGARPVTLGAPAKRQDHRYGGYPWVLGAKRLLQAGKGRDRQPRRRFDLPAVQQQTSQIRFGDGCLRMALAEQTPV